MATPSQIAANQRNAQLSTGPATPEGLERTKYNATRHGLTSKQIVLATESADEYDEFRAGLIAGHQPQGPMESYWVDEIAAAMWRLRRARKYEAVALQNAEAIFTEGKSSAGIAFDRLMKYMNSIERSLNKALSELRQIQSERLAAAAARAEAEDAKLLRANAAAAAAKHQAFIERALANPPARIVDSVTGSVFEFAPRTAAAGRNVEQAG